MDELVMYFCVVGIYIYRWLFRSKRQLFKAGVQKPTLVFYSTCVVRFW